MNNQQYGKKIVEWIEPSKYYFNKKYVEYKEGIFIRSNISLFLVFLLFFIVGFLIRIFSIISGENILYELLRILIMSFLLTVFVVLERIFLSSVVLYEKYLKFHPGMPKIIYYDDINEVRIIKKYSKNNSYYIWKIFSNKRLIKINIISRKIDIPNLISIFKRKKIKYNVE